MKIFKRNFYWFAILVVVLIGAAYGMWYARERKSPVKVPYAEVIAGFYPWEYFAGQIAGNSVKVSSLVPGGVEPHDYEPSVRDMVKLYNAKLIILNGGKFEPWGDGLGAELKESGKLLNVAKESGWENENPHFWLDPTKAGEAALKIKDRLARVDERHASEYAAGARSLLNRLAALDDEYQQQLETCAIRAVITPHDAFSYLASRYNFQTLSLNGVDPKAETSPHQLNSVISAARSLSIRMVFFEPLLGDSIAKSVAREIGGSVAPLNPIETITEADELAGKDYFILMRENLVNLRRAMVCR